MQTSLDDARFFLAEIRALVRGSEANQDLQRIRRYFRAYLHCWKCVLDYVRDVKGYKGYAKISTWVAWWSRWEVFAQLDIADREIATLLREARDDDTHNHTVIAHREIAAGLFPIVMFELRAGGRRELLSCCERGAVIAEQLIQDFSIVQ